MTPTPGARQGFAPATGERFDVIEVPANGAATGIWLAIKNQRLAIRGTVVDDTGEPVPDAQVIAEARSLATMDPGFMLAPFTLPLTVGDVMPNGSAATAGLRVGDRLVTIDGASLQGLLPPAAMVFLFNHTPGTTVALGIERRGAARTIELPLTAARP